MSEANVVPFNDAVATETFQPPAKPGAVAVLRSLTVLLMLVTAGVAGGISYSALAAAEEQGFLKDLDLSVASLRQGLIDAIEDRALTVAAMGSVFHMSPGGQEAFADFTDLADKLLRVGKGYGYNLLPIIYSEHQEGFEQYMREHSFVFNKSVEDLPNGPDRLKRKIDFGAMEFIQRGLRRNASTGSIEFEGVKSEASTKRRADGSADFITPQSHAYPYDDATLSLRGMFNARNLTLHRRDQEKILATKGTVVSAITVVSADLFRFGLARAAIYITAPLRWTPPPGDSPKNYAPLPTDGERVITGFASAYFALDNVLKRVLPDTAALHVVLRCTDPDLVGPGALLSNATSFTLTLRKGGVVNVGYGDLRPRSAVADQFARRESLFLLTTPYTLEITPAEEFLNEHFTTQPLFTCVGAIVLVVAVALAFLSFDFASSRYLRKVTIAAFEQHSSRMEQQWGLASRLAMSDVISAEITGPTCCIVGGLRELGESDLTPKQRAVVDAMSAGASLILALVEEARVDPREEGDRGDGASGKAQSIEVADLRDAVVRQCWRTVRLQPRYEQKLRLLTSLVHVSDSVPDAAALDLPRARAVFFKLLNAAVLRASGDGGGSVTWAVDYSPAQRALLSSIEYRGPPMPEEEMRLLFPAQPRNLQQAVSAFTQATGTPALGGLVRLAARSAILLQTKDAHEQPTMPACLLYRSWPPRARAACGHQKPRSRWCHQQRPPPTGSPRCRFLLPPTSDAAPQALAQEILQFMGGTLEVENTATGALFRVTLAVVQERWGPEHPFAKKKRPKGILKYRVEMGGVGGGGGGEEQGPGGAPLRPVRRRSETDGALLSDGDDDDDFLAVGRAAAPGGCGGGGGRGESFGSAMAASPGAAAALLSPPASSSSPWGMGGGGTAAGHASPPLSAAHQERLAAAAAVSTSSGRRTTSRTEQPPPTEPPAVVSRREGLAGAAILSSLGRGIGGGYSSRRYPDDAAPGDDEEAQQELSGFSRRVDGLF